jgi:uncharacterized membrane protein HdeD (DUF308 family)
LAFTIFGTSTRRGRTFRSTVRSVVVIILGLILLLIGIFAHISILTTIGIILIVVGVVLFALGSMGRAVGGRRHYF